MEMVNDMLFKGVYTALVTPFDYEGNVNEKALRNNIRYQIDGGVDGIVVLGTTGEAPTLNHDEQHRIIQIAIDEVDDLFPILVGTGSYSTEATIENTRIAAELGADGALVITPYYNRPTQEGIYRHFQALTESVGLPVIVYNHPGRTGQNLQPQTLKRIADLPNIVGFKDCSGNMLQIMEVVENIVKSRPDFSVLSGDDIVTLPMMSLGGHGVISMMSNLLPRQMKFLVDAAANGDFETARNWHYRLLSLFKASGIETNPSPIKAMMNICGMEVGECRLPLCEMLPENLSALLEVMQKVEAELEMPVRQG